MRISVDLSPLWEEVNRVTKVRGDYTFQSNAKGRDPIDIELEKGKEVPLEDVNFEKLVASVQGRQVLLYIPDHSFNFEETVSNPEKGKKFHLTYCKTLDTMRKKNRFERYCATNDLSGRFKITGGRYSNKIKEATVELVVCKNCLDRLNYKGASGGHSERYKVARDFRIPEFFETYSSCFRYEPSGLSMPGTQGYAEDWKQVSDSHKAKAGYWCQECAVDLSSVSRLLHTHHKNGVKSDNRDSNLIALCADCHRNQSDHQHMHVPHADTQLINRLRRQQDIMPGNWEGALKLVDPALFGLLDRMRSNGWSAPEVGYEMENERGEVVAEFEAAWPIMRYAIVIDAQDRVDTPKWRVETLGEAMRTL